MRRPWAQGLPAPAGRLATALWRRLAPSQHPTGHRAHLTGHPPPIALGRRGIGLRLLPSDLRPGLH